MRVLIADDEASVRHALRALIEDWGHDVISVEGGDQAWAALAAADAPPLAIIDRTMPGLDGIALCRQVRALARPTRTYIIVVSGHSSREDGLEAIEAGADDYLVKPFDPREVKARLDVGVRIATLQLEMGRLVDQLLDALGRLELRSAQLEKSESLLRDILNHSPAAIYAKDPDGRYILCNDLALGLLGKRQEEALGRTDDELMAPEMAAVVRANDRRVLETAAPLECEEAVLGRDGGRTFLSIKFPLRLGNGTPYAVCGVSTDISRRKEIEHALRQSEERFRSVVEDVKDYAIIFLDAQGCIASWNRGAERIFGFRGEDVLGRHLAALLPDEDAAAGHAEGAIAAAVAGRCEEAEAQWVRKDGTTFWAHVVLTAVRDEGGALVGFSHVLRDVTEQRRLEVELRLAQRLESVGQLAAGIAHEINTPIQFVGDNTRFLGKAFGMLTQLLEAYRAAREAGGAGAGDARGAELARLEKTLRLDFLQKNVPRAIEQSLDGIDRVAKIVRAMKQFAHPGLADDFAPADLNQAIESTLTVARNELKYVADVVTELGELPPVTCLVGDLNQVFLNLLVNAAHAIGDVVKGTEGRGTITVRTIAEGDMVRIEIGDTGGGIPEGIRERIFEPFFTTKEVGRGTGQGLALTRAIVVEKHKGTVSFTSEVGKGTTFVIRLPVDGPQRGRAAA